jgi:ankyrin repeat protein
MILSDFGSYFVDVLDYLLPLVPPSLLSAQNNAQSTPLHWAALNSHLNVIQKLVEFPGGPGVELIDMKNSAGRSPLGEAEMASFEEGAKWLVERMNLGAVKEQESEVEEGTDGSDGSRDVEVEIQDADGGVAKMTIGGP